MGRLATLWIPIAAALFMSELVVLVGSALRYTGGYPDPFALYEAMMPGQSINSSELSPCRFQEMWLVRDMIGYCQLYPDASPFRLVTIKAQGDRVQRLSLRAYGLFYGDVVARWGMPDVVEPIVTENEEMIIHARWRSGVYAITSPIDPAVQLTSLTPIYYLSVEGG